MLTMKCDMAGAATVLGTMQAIAKLQLETPVVGLMGLVENMISGNSFRLGDVLTARNGKTIEIHNTDAEGRLVLADVLDVALQHQPAQMIDLATLTGACVVALGTDIAGLMSNNNQLQNNFQLAAERTGEEVWPLPMSEHFSEQVKGKVADLKNMGDGRWGGAITAAKFLQEFVGETPWLHIDIAGPAFYDSAKPFQDAGGTAAMLRALVDFVANS
jgi:leucyl aminopeptidase